MRRSRQPEYHIFCLKRCLMLHYGQNTAHMLRISVARIVFLWWFKEIKALHKGYVEE